MERGVRYARRSPELQVAFYGQLGDSYNALGNYQKSDASYEKALQLEPGNEYALNNYSYYLSLRGEKLEAAESMSASLIEKFPDNSSYLDTYGWVLYKSGKLKEAKRIFERAVKLNTAGGIIFEHYGDVLFKLGRKEEALAQWQKAKEVGSASNLIDKKIADRKLYE
ncbi:MAG: tetratricopeptide repeat protein [Bacteroidota bacterium]